MNLAIPHEQKNAAYLVKNGKAVFSKLTQKASLSVSREQASEHLASGFPFSDFQILFSLLRCYFRGVSCTFHIGQIFNEFITITFESYRSLTLKFSCITVRLSKDRFLLRQRAISFSKKGTSVVFFVDQLVHVLVCLVCYETMSVKTS